MPKNRTQQQAPKPKGKGKARAAAPPPAPAPAAASSSKPSPKTRLSKAKATPLPQHSDDDLDAAADLAAMSDDDDEELDALLQGDDLDMDSGAELDGESGDEDDEDSDEEEDDVTEEALERMMKLLGPVDAAELGLLDGEDEEEGSDDDEEESGEDDEEEDEELKPYEDLDEVDPDVAPVEKNVTNDKAALERVLASFKTDAGFFDTLTLTNPKPLNVPDADNDLERELEFYKQSLWAAMHAETLFNRADLPFHRPTDYFAEMVKTDAHMAKIRQGLLDEQAGMKASEEARKLRDAKKFGKKVQHERLRERERDKKAVGDKLESLKKRRKGDASFGGDDFDVALEDALASAGPASKKRKTNESERPGRARAGISRAGRDKKFGFGGGAGRRSKENNMKEDDRSGGGRGGGGKGRGGGQGGGSRGGGKAGMSRKRPGKSRRQAV
ncbi:hypothetical protein JCM9279_003062 [Rhodotorula babjevae]